MNIVFDIGGTKMRVVGTRDGRKFEGEPHVVETPKDFSKGIEKFVLIAKQAALGRSIKRVVGGVAGVLDKSGVGLARSPNLAGWVDQPLKRELEQALNAPVELFNDSALVGLGEAARGAGRDFKIVAYVTVSTGVGGVRITNKKIDESAFGFEPGHQIVRRESSQAVTLEEAVSGRALEKRLGQKPYQITDEKIWDELARELAYGLHNTILHWSPVAVVLGGSMITRPIGIKLDRVRHHLREISKILPQLPQLRLAELGDFGGLYGGLEAISSSV